VKKETSQSTNKEKDQIRAINSKALSLFSILCPQLKMQLKQSQISDNLRKLDAQSISKLSDDDIYHYLKHEIGLSIGPMVQSTRALYEKLLNESILHLDNIEEYLGNYTKTGDEFKQSTESTKTVDSGHGQSMNNSLPELHDIHNLSSTNQINRNGLENRQNLLDETDNSKQSTLQANLSNKSNVSNKSNISNQTSVSSNSNISNVSNKTNGSTERQQADEIESKKSNSLNVNQMQGSIITSPIPTIKITSDNLEMNFDNKWPNIQTQNDTRCSTPIERQNISKRTFVTADPHLVKSFEPFNNQRTNTVEIGGPQTKERENGLTHLGLGSIPRNPLNNPFKNVNLNRNVFKDYTSGSLSRNLGNQINRPVELNRNLEPTFKTAATAPVTTHHSNPIPHIATKKNQQARPLHTNTLQFSDNEDANDDCGAGYEYKITKTNQTVRPRLSGRFTRVPFTKSEYMKRSVPNYQTNHPPQKNSLAWLNTLLIFILALFIFSIVLAFTSYL